MSVNDRIAQVMEAEGLNVNAFAQAVGMKYLTLYHIVSPGGRRSDPPAATLLKIKTAFPDIDLNWLVTGEGRMKLPIPKTTDQTLEVVLKELRELRTEVEGLKR